MEVSVNQQKYIDLQQVSSLLGVSSATVKNWIKYNYLKPQRRDAKLVFRATDVENLKAKIISGEIDRLNKRANKQDSQITFIPDEYVDDGEVVKFTQTLIMECKQKKLTRDRVLYSLILNLLRNNGLIDKKFIPRNKFIQVELDWWDKRSGGYYLPFVNIDLPEANDILGLIYQSLTTEGDKAEGGAYYTPKKIVDEIVDMYLKEDSLVLDPCCGTGQFLLSTAKRVKDPSKIWGFDIDEIAVRLARLNLMLYFDDKDFTPNIYHKNSLTLDNHSLSSLNNTKIPQFDLVITNPPWGVHFSKEQNIELKSIFPEIESGEAFSYFIKQGLNLLKKKGVLSFILPESILNIKVHKDIRSILIKNNSIKKIKYLGRVFKNVFTPVIRLDVFKVDPSLKNTIEAEKNDIKYLVNQHSFQDDEDFILSVFTDKQDITLFDKVYSVKHITLKDKADWALGVVTGNNAKYVSYEKTETNEPVVTGKEVKRFLTITPSKYITFEPDQFQQVAAEYKYRAKEKLFYKFISKELVFAYDNKQILSLNSANILIPKIENYPIKTILALFNSSLYQFLYQKKFGAIKILKSDIEKLPLPIIDEDVHKKIDIMVSKLVDNTQQVNDRKKTFTILDEFIMDIFKINTSERKHIIKSIKVSDKLLNNS